MLASISWWRRPVLVAGFFFAAFLLLSPSAQAHHLMELMQLQATPLAGLLSGLAHPILGPDHLLFLLALSLVGLQHRTPWMLALLVTGLAGSAAGLLLPGLPAAEALVSFTLVVVALVLMARLDRRLLLPAFALHGYVLSAAVLGWSAAPMFSYLAGLLLSQAALLLLALVSLRHLTTNLLPSTRRAMALILTGLGLAWTWSSLLS
jgi:urease accessory protein